MATKKTTPPPIDRPLSKAYLRQFIGWSNEFPPGQSGPNSLRVMENIWIDRNGAAAVRPGLRHLSYDTSPELSIGAPGRASRLAPVGSMEPFYLNDGSRAMLYAVREGDGRVGFRALLLMDGRRTVATLPECGFSGYDPAAVPFSRGTGYVEYVQIDNTIIALSDNGEPARHFHVGSAKTIVIPQEVTSPAWTVGDKPRVVHPAAAWINSASPGTIRRNLLRDPSMRLGSEFWRPGVRAAIEQVAGGGLKVRSLPARMNLVRSPLHDPARTGTAGWAAAPGAELSVSGGMLQASSTAAGLLQVESSTMVVGVQERTRYRIALDLGASDLHGAVLYVRFGSASGASIGSPPEFLLPPSTAGRVGGRWSPPPFLAPEGTVSIRLGFRGAADRAGRRVRFSGVVLCRSGESTELLHGDLGTDFRWLGDPNDSASVHHPPVDVELKSARVQTSAQKPHALALEMRGTPGRVVRTSIGKYSGADVLLSSSTSAVTTLSSTWQRPTSSTGALTSAELFLRAHLTFTALGPDDAVEIKEALMEETSAALGAFFSGSSSHTDSSRTYHWEGEPHRSISVQTVLGAARPALTAQAPAATTLISSDAAKNTYKMGLLYAFENEVGESAPSQIVEVRMMRGWSQWLWKTPGADGQPTGGATTDPDLAADQLVVEVPRTAYDRAVLQGAVRWAVYAMAWSDQDPVPVTLEKVAVRELYPDPLDRSTRAHYYENGGWLSITPQRTIGQDSMLLPSPEHLENSSYPLRHKAGAAESDRLIMVGDPNDPATISWSSNQPGRFTKFTPSAGGGRKTLSSGNLHLPHAVSLWQNPQSVDTLTVLCTSSSERSVTYYMAPFTTNSQQGSVTGMGFEQTTNTPGSDSPYAVEVLNNALYRPLDSSLMKSTAANYNINHKVMTEQISRSWSQLLNKYLMVSEQLDNRLYYLVHNSQGEPLQEGCTSNEMWVLDTAAEQGHWSRFLIQASSLSTVDLGGSIYVAVLRPDGICYLDPDHRMDDEVDLEGVVRQVPIPWRMETNLQGANRAHDAWAHVQQAIITLGDFEGAVRWGLKGWTLQGRYMDLHKVTEAAPPIWKQHRWGLDDMLLVRRDLKEWFFYAESLPGRLGAGSVQLVQYRYTPVTVNAGHEFGSVETFEYGSPVPGHTVNGVPEPFSTASRTWPSGM